MSQPKHTKLTAIEMAVMDTANIWLIREREGRADPAALAAWLAASPSHAEAYRRAASVYAAVEVPATRVGRKTRNFSRWRNAASVLFLISAGWLLRDLPVELTSTVTAVGETRELSLPDGSQVELNAASAARVDYSEAERKIELRRGEAWFAVTRDVARPFVVIAGDTRITVLGTKFNVKRRDDAVLVSVAEGRVEVRDASRNVTLTPGRAVVASPDRFEVTDIPLTQVAEWRTGWMGFEQTTFEAVIDELSSYHRGPIFIAARDLRTRPIAARLNLQSPEAALKIAVSAASAEMIELPGGVRIIF
ncbi:FecR family protein [Steroidobacter flavus]|uniref:FecR family protein n=1 Tax=Steroidobacter flavus TaxID=1842136 RepID=A0ABV8T2I1_9GAMM